MDEVTCREVSQDSRVEHLTWITTMRESFCRAPKTSSLCTYCISLYFFISATISEMFSGLGWSKVSFPVRGRGFRYLWKSFGTMVKIEAMESLLVSSRGSQSFMEEIFSWSQMNKTKAERMKVRRYDDERRFPTAGAGIRTRRRP